MVLLTEHADGDLSAQFEHSVEADVLQLKFTLNIDQAPMDWQATNQVGQFQTGLWHGTCFELFLVEKESTRYLELNFTPGGNFAIFPFANLRVPASESTAGDIAKTVPIKIVTQSEGPQFSCAVDLELQAIARFFSGNSIQLKPTMVVKRSDLAYLAPFHGEGPPDFHDFSKAQMRELPVLEFG